MEGNPSMLLTAKKRYTRPPLHGTTLEEIEEEPWMNCVVHALVMSIVDADSRRKVKAEYGQNDL